MGLITSFSPRRQLHRIKPFAEYPTPTTVGFSYASGLAGGQPATTCGLEACSPASKQCLHLNPCKIWLQTQTKVECLWNESIGKCPKNIPIYTSNSIDAFSLPLQQTCSKRFGVWPPTRPWTPRRRLDVRESFAEIRGTAVLRDHSAENLGVLRGL